MSEHVEAAVLVAFTILALARSMDHSIVGVVHPGPDSGQVVGVNIKRAK